MGRPDLLTIGTVIAAIVLIGAGAFLIGTGRIGGDTTTQRTFLIGGVGGAAAPYLISGMGTIDSPATENVSVERAPLDQTVSAIADKEIVGGLVPLGAVPLIADQNSDMRIVPAYFALPSNITGIYVRADSDIQTLSDLEGRTIGIPDTPGARPLTHITLEEQGSVNVRSVDIVTYPDTRDFYTANLPADAEDARYLFGYPSPDELRALGHPMEHIEARFGTKPPMYVFVVSDQRYADIGIGMASSFRNPGISSVPENATATDRRVINALSNVRTRSNVAPLTDDVLEAGQYIIDYESLGISSPVDLAELRLPRD